MWVIDQPNYMDLSLNKNVWNTLKQLIDSNKKNMTAILDLLLLRLKSFSVLPNWGDGRDTREREGGARQTGERDRPEKDTRERDRREIQRQTRERERRGRQTGEREREKQTREIPERWS